MNQKNPTRNWKTKLCDDQDSTFLFVRRFFGFWSALTISLANPKSPSWFWNLDMEKQNNIARPYTSSIYIHTHLCIQCKDGEIKNGRLKMMLKWWTFISGSCNSTLVKHHPEIPSMQTCNFSVVDRSCASHMQILWLWRLPQTKNPKFSSDPTLFKVQSPRPRYPLYTNECCCNLLLSAIAQLQTVVPVIRCCLSGSTGKSGQGFCCCVQHLNFWASSHMISYDG